MGAIAHMFAENLGRERAHVTVRDRAHDFVGLGVEQDDARRLARAAIHLDQAQLFQLGEGFPFRRAEIFTACATLPETVTGFPLPYQCRYSSSIARR